METTTRSQESSSLGGLVAGLREDVRLLVREEVKLAKTEVSEKLKLLRRNALYLAIGGTVALLAGGLLLASFAFAAAFAFETLGLTTGVALFLGFLVVAVIAGLVGGGLMGKAISALSQETLVPEKTLETLRELKDGNSSQAQVKAARRAFEPRDTRNSDQIRSDVDETRSRIEREVQGLKTRLTLRGMASDVITRVRCNPVLSVGVGVGTGLAGYILMRMGRMFGRRRTA